jgi:hypothetical protein
MANARAHRHLQDREDAQLTFSRIEHFKGFAASWMKTQLPGYRDYDKWCRNLQAMQKGRAKLASRVHEISWYLRHLRPVLNSDVLRLYENADYSRVPIVQVRDTRIAWLKSARLFPKELGLQVLVYTHEHPPVHIHVEFLGSDRSTRLEWPSLTPLRGEFSLSGSESKNLTRYLKKYGSNILEKLQKVYPQVSLSPVA